MTSLYYESHVTIEPVFDGDLDSVRNLCQSHGFRIADLLMQKRPVDTPERSRFDTFCSSRHVDLIIIEQRMFDLIATLQKNGYKVWRYKIENVMIDSKIDDSHMRLGSKA